MTAPIPGSEVFSSRPTDLDALARSLPPSLPVHTVTQEQIDAVDPLTYEVIRHRLWSVTDEMGEALKRMSGSPIVTDANDRPRKSSSTRSSRGRAWQAGKYARLYALLLRLAGMCTLWHGRVSWPIEARSRL